MKRKQGVLFGAAVVALLAAIGLAGLSASPAGAPSLVAVQATRSQAVAVAKEIPECPEALGANPMGGPCIPRALRNAPPDPGPENDKTLAGIDSNGNGVRDDIERYIAANYGDSPQKVAYLMQYAKAIAAFTAVDMAAPTEALAHARQQARANSCASALIGPQDRPFTTEEMRHLNDFFNAAQDVTLQHLNTPARLATFVKNERLLAGHGLTLDNPQPADVVCEFLASQNREPIQGERK